MMIDKKVISKLFEALNVVQVRPKQWVAHLKLCFQSSSDTIMNFTFNSNKIDWWNEILYVPPTL